VCERHVGVGITVQDIDEKKLPLPRRDIVPSTIEEEIISLADKFFSKGEERLGKEKTIEEVRNEQKKFGEANVQFFDAWIKKFF
jgi:uncharacterized protein